MSKIKYIILCLICDNGTLFSYMMTIPKAIDNKQTRLFRLDIKTMRRTTHLVDKIIHKKKERS